MRVSEGCAAAQDRDHGLSRESKLEFVRRSLWLVTFNNPPIDFIHPPMIRYKHVAVVLFDSADADFVLNHWDLTADQFDLRRMKTATGLHP